MFSLLVVALSAQAYKLCCHQVPLQIDSLSQQERMQRKNPGYRTVQSLYWMRIEWSARCDHPRADWRRRTVGDRFVQVGQILEKGSAYRAVVVNRESLPLPQSDQESMDHDKEV